MSEPSRRQLLKTAAVGCATCGLAACVGPINPTGGNDTSSSPATPSNVPGGNVSDYFSGDLVAVGWSVAVGYDSGGIYAMTTICTHAGCDMANYGQVNSRGLFCGCHGSEFDVDGNVIRGPAFRPLQHYKVTVGSNGDIHVDSTNVVSQGTRTPA